MPAPSLPTAAPTASFTSTKSGTRGRKAGDTVALPFFPFLALAAGTPMAWARAASRMAASPTVSTPNMSSSSASLLAVRLPPQADTPRAPPTPASSSAAALRLARAGAGSRVGARRRGRVSMRWRRGGSWPERE